LAAARWARAAKLSFATVPPWAFAVARWIRAAASGVMGVAGVVLPAFFVVMVLSFQIGSCQNGTPTSCAFQRMESRHGAEGFFGFFKQDSWIAKSGRDFNFCWDGDKNRKPKRFRAHAYRSAIATVERRIANISGMPASIYDVQATEMSRMGAIQNSRGIKTMLIILYNLRELPSLRRHAS
jgi:hypothetical protein